jgi:CP family cyanate transporter-like MFS transporter
VALRPQLVGAGPLVGAIQADLGISHAVAGLLTTIPVLCMGVFAPIAPFVAARIGTGPAIAASLALIGVFGLGRSAVSDGPIFLGLTFGVGIGMGIAGSLLPVFVKERPTLRAVRGSAAYSSGLQLGSAAAGGLAVPIALALGGWRAALGLFSGITLLLLAPWLALGVLRGPKVLRRIAPNALDFRDGRGWILAAIFAMYGVVYYGLIAWLADAYVEAGWSAAAAGGLIGLLNVAALTGALTIGVVTGRLVSYRVAVAILASAFAAATVGFVELPALAVVFAVVAGYANGALFPLILALPLRITHSSNRVAGLSSVMLGGGYTIAALSPIALGAIRDSTGSFRTSLLGLGLIAIAFAVGVSLVSRWPAPAPEVQAAV